MNTLHNTILAEKLDEVAGEYTWEDYTEYCLGTKEDQDGEWRKAALLAMGEQQKFYEWLGSRAWFAKSKGKWANVGSFEHHTLEELYQIYKKATKNG